MGSPLEGPNPLRPYFVPPSIGLAHTKTEALARSPPTVNAANVTSFGSSARNIIPDFDYSDYLGDASPSVVDSVRQLLEEALWRYSRTLMSQPFEVAKTILQVYVAEGEDERTQAAIHATRRPTPGFRDEQDDVCPFQCIAEGVAYGGILTFLSIGCRSYPPIRRMRAIISLQLLSLLELPLLLSTSVLNTG
jgi:fusion and transport protein UGO1